jgi:hypothetical protein
MRILLDADTNNIRRFAIHGQRHIHFAAAIQVARQPHIEVISNLLAGCCNAARESLASTNRLLCGCRSDAGSKRGTSGPHRLAEDANNQSREQQERTSFPLCTAGRVVCSKISPEKQA